VIRISSIGIIRKTLASFRVHAKQASAANFGKSLDEQKQMEILGEGTGNEMEG